ncbi:MAG: hypothetical protein ACRCX4_11450, partial [Bacteroidales bacterium]
RLVEFVFHCQLFHKQPPSGLCCKAGNEPRFESFIRSDSGFKTRLQTNYTFGVKEQNNEQRISGRYDINIVSGEDLHNAS